MGRRVGPLLLCPHLVEVSCCDSRCDIQWAIDMVTTDPSEGTQIPPAWYDTGIANQCCETAKETAYRYVLREHYIVSPSSSH